MGEEMKKDSEEEAEDIRVQINRSVEHIGETNPVRHVFWDMDKMVKGLKYGIQQGDDAVVVGDMVINMEGPYPLKIGRKTGLIHTCTDIVAMGAVPLFAMDAMQVESVKQAEEIAEDIKKQSMGLGVPVIGGNTQLETDLTPCISFAACGKLIAAEPIPDGGAKKGDRLILFGEVTEGSIGERVHRAKIRYNAFWELLKSGVKVNAVKDASRGGWFGNMLEMMIKSKNGAEITSIPYPRVSRYMGAFILSIPDKEVKKVLSISAKKGCPAIEFGRVTGELGVTIGEDIFVEKEDMKRLIRNMPYKNAARNM